MNILLTVLKYYPNAEIVTLNNRDLLSTNGKYILPKRIHLNVVRLYNNDLALPKDKTVIACINSRGELIAEVPLTQDFVDKLTTLDVMTVKGIKFIYLAKVREKGNYSMITVTRPRKLKERMDKLIESGLFESYSHIVRYAVAKMFRKRHEI